MRLSRVEAFSREQCWLEGTLLWPHSLCWGCRAEQTAFPRRHSGQIPMLFKEGANH